MYDTVGMWWSEENCMCAWWMENLTSIGHARKKRTLIGLRGGPEGKVLATNDLNSTPGSHMLEGENWRLQVLTSLCMLQCMLQGTHMFIPRPASTALQFGELL